MRSLATGIAVVLMAGAFLAGRRSSPVETAAAPAPRRAAHAGCAHPPPEPPRVVAPEARQEAAEELRRLQADLRRVTSDRTVQLNTLQDFLAAHLAERRISADQILEMIRAETDPATLDLLQGVLAADPEAADQPGVLDAFLTMAGSDPDPVRRQTAIAYLGTAWDRDGRVRQTLFETARGSERTFRLAALGTLQSYALKNRDQAAAVNDGLLALAAGEPDGDVRAQALGSVEIRSAGDEVVRRLTGFLVDPAPGARLAAAERLGEAPPGSRPSVLPTLEAALSQETQEGVKQLLLLSLVRLGRAEAADALRRTALRDPHLRSHAEDYLAVLAKGYADWAQIEQAKADLEASRR